MIKCVNCINVEFCKWESLYETKDNDLREETNGMLEVNCSQFQDEQGNTGEYSKLECKTCKFKDICKYQRPIEDYTFRRKTKQCLNIQCNKYQEPKGIELLKDEDCIELIEHRELESESLLDDIKETEN